MVDLPVFTYHPDPLGTGSVILSDADCLSCEQQRGYIYVGPAYAETEPDEDICPWCIADGTAHQRFEAVFTDPSGVGMGAELPPGVVEEVARRTPGFSGWQQEYWWACCGDAATFVGCADAAQLRRRWPGAIQPILSTAGLSEADLDWYLGSGPYGGPTAYVFRCGHCGEFGGYSDCL